MAAPSWRTGSNEFARASPNAAARCGAGRPCNAAVVWRLVDTSFVLIFRRPHGALAEFVGSIWLYRGEAPAFETELVLPTGDLDPVIDLGRSGSSSPVPRPDGPNHWAANVRGCPNRSASTNT